MNGILAVWKPAGWTSHDVVAKARRLLRTKRIGHAGTLDPQVTGVLPLCIGKATRVVEYMQDLPKAYEAVLQLGLSTDTQDLTGTVMEELGTVRVSEQELRRTLVSFVGEIEQLPPMYSAVKVDGKRLYELAREGKTAQRKPRKATIYELELLEADLERDHPVIRFSVRCSKGTYIRTLCVDIGQALGVPAVMAKLVRTQSGGLTERDCLTLEEVEALQEDGTLQARLLPPDAVLAHLPQAVAGEEAARMALQGRRIAYCLLREREDGERLTRLYGEDGTFLGVFQPESEVSELKPVKVFKPEETE
ncbi:tRNA pseudouridine(55) synthase TruB [Paenibacillus beijingensis]|uniref:tRNA pseudouridine synthase B n=1 Tax=Paenibacillus beijingensis TaxID=1126833 RepID=A0A0D5NRX6_9BACL|nr:tRNA pseudouridine(55) synthase TruB [Paenibacillus beijingensis]AJY77905.1 pseudouridine synthase [Paenibacillus beijingensis]